MMNVCRVSLWIFFVFIISCSNQSIEIISGASTTTTTTLASDDTPDDEVTTPALKATSAACLLDGAASESPFASGDGSEEDPYIICGEAQLSNIDDSPSNLSSHYKLGANLILTQTYTQPVVNGDFAGTFDGDSYRIENFVLDSSAEANIGFFKKIDDGALVKKVNFVSADVTGIALSAVLAGSAEGSTIEDIYVSGKVQASSDPHNFIGALLIGVGSSVQMSAIMLDGEVEILNAPQTSSTWCAGLASQLLSSSLAEEINAKVVLDIAVTSTNSAGGLVGILNASTLRKSKVEVNMNSPREVQGGAVGAMIGASLVEEVQSSGSVTGEWGVGGLVGYAADTATIRRSFSTAQVTGTMNRIGGILGVGAATNVISESYYAGSLTGSGGGIYGYIGAQPTVTNSFWDSDVFTSSSDQTGATGLSSSAMKSTSTYSAWDSSVWNLVNGSYPSFK